MPRATNAPERVTSSERVDAVDQLETQMTVLARRLEHASRRTDPDQRIDRAGYLLTRTLDSRGPMSVNQLARVLGLDGSTVTRQVAALVDRDYVRRSPDPRDRRAVVITLTDDGRREMEAMRQGRVDRLDLTVGAWPAADVSALAELIERLNRSILPAPDTTDET